MRTPLENVRRHVSFLAPIMAVIAGCATAPVGSVSEGPRIAGSSKLLLLTPLVDCIDPQTGTPCRLDANLSGDLQASLIGELGRHLGAKEIDLLADPSENEPLHGDFDGDETRRLMFRITSVDSLESSNDDQARLSELEAATGASHLLSTRCRVYAGPAGFWNPLSGQIASSGSRIVIEANLYSLSDRRNLWTGVSQARVSPEKGLEQISLLVTDLLKGFANDPGEMGR